MQAARHGTERTPSARRRARRQRRPPEGRPAADPPARWLALPDGGLGAARRHRAHGRARRGRLGGSGAARGFPLERRPRRRLPERRPPALPRERVPPARRDLVRVPRDPEDRTDLRRARAAVRRATPRRGAPRPDPRHGRDRLREDDDARGHDRLHQPGAPAAHRHDRGPDRDPARRSRLHRQPARGRARHRVVRAGAPPRAAPGPRRDPDRRAARRRDGADGAPGRRVRASRPLDDAHDRRRRDDRADDRVLPRGQAAADPVDHCRRPRRRREPAAPAEGRRRAGRRGRGDGDEQSHRRPDPRGACRRDLGGDRGGLVLPDADVQRRAARPRHRRARRAGRGRERRVQQVRLRGRARPRAQGERRQRPGAGGRGPAARDCAASGPRPAHRPPRAVTRRALLALGLALALGSSAVAATPRADSFAALASAPSTLPGSDAPNAPGSIAFPASLSTPPAVPEKLDRDRLEALWKGAGAAYGIPWQVLAAINEVESNFGRNMGPSSAGAIGWMQFMPSTWERWGVDANHDSVADPWSAEDAIYAAARYLAASGGRDDIAAAVFSYNHAQWYVNEVLGLAKLFHESGSTVTFTLDRLQQRLQTASANVLVASRGLVRAPARAEVLPALAARLAARASSSPLLSDQLNGQKRAVLAAVRRDDAAAEVARLRARLDSAQRELDV